MSAPPDRAAARCACTNISLMQLFHELKQKFPAAPDHAVSAAISAYCHDKRACEQHLESHAEASLAHAYHASSSAAARKLKHLRTNLVPIECRNRPIEQHAVPVSSSVRAINCDVPQNAKLSSSVTFDNNSNKINLEEATKQISINSKDGVFDATNENTTPTLQFTNAESPVTINIDSCVAKSGETPSDVEGDDTTQRSLNETECNTNTDESTGSNYRILKSHKIKSNLNERLDKPKFIGKKSNDLEILQKEEVSHAEDIHSQKPKRPCTLEFIKPQSDVNISQQTIQEPDPCRTVSPIARPAPPPDERAKLAAPPTPWVEQSYPLNLSVNVNCHMDIANRPHTFYPNTWLDDYDSPRAFTSVNLTVCTPTSGAMQSPVREGGDPRAFEGHVTVTVSPTRPPRRHAPPPPPQHSAAAPTFTARHFLSTPKRDQAISENSLIARQLARKQLLVAELARERERLAQVTRETTILAAPLPSPAATHRLREQVERLRQQCQLLTRRLDSQNAQRAERDGFYNPYPSHEGGGVGVRATPVPTRPAPAPPADDAPSWQCQICTFSNHGLLNKCEQCEMPRILLGTTDTTRSMGSSIGAITHEARIESSKLLGSPAASNQSESACV